MRLLNVKTLELDEFTGHQTPRYAVLSHRWSENPQVEVSFHDMRAKRFKHKEGFKKIKHTCREAQSEGLSHCWIDTCCIDKSSSAELSEAIR
jgi:hypothetical protein